MYTVCILVAMEPVLREFPVGVREDVVTVDGHLVSIIVETIDEVESALTIVNQRRQCTHRHPLTS